jgi:hypothetical protein
VSGTAVAAGIIGVILLLGLGLAAVMRLRPGDKH